MIGGLATIHRLNLDGSVERSPKAEPDAVFELLDISVTPARPDTSDLPEGYVSLFVRAPSRNFSLPDFGKTASSKLTFGIDFPNISVFIRADAWFIDNPAFPLAYPFDERTKAGKLVKPSPDVYPGVTVSCFRAGNKVAFNCPPSDPGH
jgi:hypothetical protein